MLTYLLTVWKIESPKNTWLSSYLSALSYIVIVLFLISPIKSIHTEYSSNKFRLLNQCRVRCSALTQIQQASQQIPLQVHPLSALRIQHQFQCHFLLWVRQQNRQRMVKSNPLTPLPAPVIMITIDHFVIW